MTITKESIKNYSHNTHILHPFSDYMGNVSLELNEGFLFFTLFRGINFVKSNVMVIFKHVFIIGRLV